MQGSQKNTHSIFVMSSFALSFALAANWLFPFSAFAAKATGEPLLAIGAGVSAPSATDAFSDNPAGLSYNNHMKIVGAAAADNRNFNPFSAQGHLLFGNGRVGGGLGMHTYRRGHEDRVAADFGLGAYADSLGSMIGVSGTTYLRKNDRSGNDLYPLNVGMLMNPYGDARIGFQLVDVMGGIDYYAAGVAMNLSSGTVFSVDGSSKRNLDGATIKPALGIGSDGFGFHTAYGFRLNSRSSSYIPKGWGGGFHLALSKDFQIQGVYNHHSKYYVAIIAGF